MSAFNSAVPSPRLNVSSPLGLKVTPDAPRRRLTSETLKGGGISGSNPNTVHDLQDKIMVQSLHDRSKHMAELKRELFVSALGSGHRKLRSKPEKPKWQFYLSFFFKICLLLVAILWLGLLIWKWRNMIKYSKGLYDFDSDGRLTEVEASLKNTARRLQDQLDVVDKKIGTEAEVAKKELNKHVEETDLLSEKKLKWLVSLTDDLDKSLSEIKATGFLSKEELQIFSNKFKDKEKCSGSTHEILDDIRKFAKEIVEKEIEKHAADGLGRVDYALASGGAKVINHSKPYLIGKSSSWLAIGSSFNRVHPDPNAKKMLEPSFGEPGQCFALHGNNGFVEIRLRTGIVPEAVTLEHVSKMVAYDRLSAPKDCTVTAWSEGPGSDPLNGSEKKFVLAEFSYNLEKSNAQTFYIQTAVSELVNVVRLDFSSNHGSSTHTCIYRFRVHGSEPTSLNVSAEGKEKY
ncbi:SUN domain-containing protein 1-like [Zingiber officinale]|uniref:SUN domain-containing protein n=1 Tax=Zingiber officinale TaxID=94328 RepID=A0A8J5BKS8_ZINOF|nr:SUN domain-containing protein 1-like [Zingiber officinale]XP_042443092.1 SUN domain-containing protein 1-like [Zingiber officinale]XP_042443093.1 SUN domain-containing protein 1-like [Zingiber officinale]XP_042443094.1 SUN domain-containing protein 1-like [Zingiber officinale]KAG6473968.1 hypothetical protein ZIOFF_067888 [Zingiber officinale]